MREQPLRPIYLDHCSTTPVDQGVLDAMLPFLRELCGNPGTPHELVGGHVRSAIRAAREDVAELVNCLPNEIIWTSGATESNNLAILGFASDVPPNKRHIITQATEHSAVLEPCRHLQQHGWDVTSLTVDAVGRVCTRQLEDAIKDTTSLVSIMWGNNEIGTIQPVKEIADICADRGIVFHCDAAQAAGKVAIDVETVGVSMLTLSAHKFYGPKGAGALFVRDLGKRRVITPRVLGGGQERGLRAGTLNVPCIIGMGAACSLAHAHLTSWHQHTQQLRHHFEAQLFAQLDHVSINGDRETRLPHISNIAFHGTDNEGLLTMLPGLVASTGSACHVADFAPSHVLDALPITPKPTECSLRFGFGKENTAAQIESAARSIVDAVNQYRAHA